MHDRVYWFLKSLFSFRIGYRHYFEERPWMYRVAFTPFIERFGQRRYIYPSAGGSIGYRF